MAEDLRIVAEEGALQVSGRGAHGAWFHLVVGELTDELVDFWNVLGTGGANH
ncbi:hypothetical protein NQ028_07410 [Corynebacterium phoceense]|uniref:hypothetical protein n=1 Tax=Corynebacterium phoceense TaxID=1686286 RepID=UPI00211BEF66|nr:hypothetical protein [Corynebacterium phoceense]MCQ9340970.1 hypothetical protein [Corynebacterium phoceense]